MNNEKVMFKKEISGYRIYIYDFGTVARAFAYRLEGTISERLWPAASLDSNGKVNGGGFGVMADENAVKVLQANFS